MHKTPRARGFIVIIETSVYNFYSMNFLNFFSSAKNLQSSQQLNATSAIEKSEKLSAHLLQEKLRYEALLSSIGEGTIATDRNGRIIFMNKVAEELTGLRFKEAKGQLFVNSIQAQNEKGETIPLDDRPIFLALLYRKNVTVQDYFYIRKDGRRFPIIITASPILLEGNLIGAISIFRDITKEKEIDRAKSEFVSLASHQLRTPLSTIGWCAEMLLSGDAGKPTKKQKEYLSEIYSAKEKMADLVAALLNVSRLELGTFMIDPQSVDLQDIAKSIINELKPEILKKKIAIEEEYDKDVPVDFIADINLIRIIFQNLISNAVKYTPEKGKVRIAIEKKNDTILIQVQDSGCGIPERQQEKIFTKLFRADNARSIATDGSGLGLYIVKSVLDNSGGRIWFSSKENEGSTFYVTLPASGMQRREGARKLDA